MPRINPPDHNRRHVQFTLTDPQLEYLDTLSPTNMSRHQAAKHLLLTTLDPSAARDMVDRARNGKRRLTDPRY